MAYFWYDSQFQPGLPRASIATGRSNQRSTRLDGALTYHPFPGDRASCTPRCSWPNFRPGLCLCIQVSETLHGKGVNRPVPWYTVSVRCVLLWRNLERPIILRVHQLIHEGHRVRCAFIEIKKLHRGVLKHLLMRGSSKCAFPASRRATVTFGFSLRRLASTHPAVCQEEQLSEGLLKEHFPNILHHLVNESD